MHAAYENIASAAQTCVPSAMKGASELVATLKLRTNSPPPMHVQTPKSPETSTIKCDVMDFGYGSSNSHPGAELSKLHVASVDKVEGSWRWRPKPTLLSFDNRSLPPLTWERFYNLTRQYNKALCDYIRAPPHPREVRDVAMILESLGENKETATPWVYVDVQKGAGKKAMKFFKQPHVKEDYKPTPPTIRTPHLGIRVREVPPMPTASLDDLAEDSQNEVSPGEARTAVYGDPSLMVETTCGSTVRVLKVGDGTNTGRATIGGLVRVVGADNTDAIYALTAGHFLDRENVEYGEDNDHYFDYDSDDEDDESDVSFDEDEGYELELSSINPECKGSAFVERAGPPTQAVDPCEKIGNIFKASRDDLQDRPNLDWALIDISDKGLYLPNIVSSHEVAQILPQPSAGSTANVILSTATRGPLTGTLTNMWSYLGLSPGKSMAKTYLLTLSDGKVIQAGDSGSWVVDASTNEVYGHIVASDAAGRAYVIPLSDIFEDITSRLSSTTIELPLRHHLSSFKHEHGLTRTPSAPIAHDSTATADGQGLSEPLSNPKDAVVDIVFVHGLNGHRENTWTSEYDILWPKTLLSVDLPKARVFTWGYDSKIVHFWGSPSQNRINDHSANLLTDLANMREMSESLDRPIILVAHSMGGLVCANALVNSETSPEKHIRNTGNAIRGMMFLGTPHAGSSKAKWAEQARKFLDVLKGTNKELLKTLEDNSGKLSDLGTQFPQYLRKRGEPGAAGVSENKIEVLCFFEEYATKPMGQIVTPESATLVGYERIGIPANHSKMCKFSNAQESGYVSVSGALKRWVALLTPPPNRHGSNDGYHVTQHGSTFGDNHGGFMIGNANSFGGGTFLGGHAPIFGTQNLGAKKGGDR